VRELFRTTWELPQRALIDLAAARGPYIDQSQSLNLFLASPTIGKLSSMYLYAWKAGLKTTYYLRSRPATRIQQSTVDVVRPPVAPLGDRSASDEEIIACSLENPEACEACQ
jgi:ribonucleoside-diphosphate reductase alpha chain